MKELLKELSIIYYIVKKLKEKYPSKQVGKVIIQKLMYLFENQVNKDYEFTMYHYGPHSAKVGKYINLAEALELIIIGWDPEKGYLININESAELPAEIAFNEKDIIDQLVDKYGAFSAAELSIIATALYIKNNFGITDSSRLIDTVLSLKPNNQKGWIKDVLRKANIIE